MTTPERIEELQRLRVEFESSATSHDRLVGIAQTVRRFAEEELPTRCIECGHGVFYAPAPRALIPGHVYSQDGVREQRMTGLCEFCFDLLLLPRDEEWRSDAEIRRLEAAKDL